MSQPLSRGSWGVPNPQKGGSGPPRRGGSDPPSGGGQKPLFLGQKHEKMPFLAIFRPFLALFGGVPKWPQFKPRQGIPPLRGGPDPKKGLWHFYGESPLISIRIGRLPGKKWPQKRALFSIFLSPHRGRTPEGGVGPLARTSGPPRNARVFLGPLDFIKNSRGALKRLWIFL